MASGPGGGPDAYLRASGGSQGPGAESAHAHGSKERAGCEGGAPPVLERRAPRARMAVAPSHGGSAFRPIDLVPSADLAAEASDEQGHEPHHEKARKHG